MEDKKLSEIVANFRNPPGECRGAPFWSWNGRLEPEELRRQIRGMKEAGLGGFFMHARVGLNTPYLSQEWFDCVRACIDEAKKLGMKAYLYDEDRWPSGAAGGLVTRDTQYASRIVRAVEFSDPAECRIDEQTLALYKVKTAADGVAGAVRLDAVPAVLAPGEKLIRCRWEIAAPSAWYNNESYLDVLNRDAVKRFIEVTHEAYYREVGDEFGKTVPAIFTDEPNFPGVNSLEADGSRTAPWTGAFAGYFRKRFGYDILDHLLEVFYRVDGKPYSPALMHYMECLTSLFVENFSHQIGDWCEAHNLELTGHVLCEDTLSSQSALVGNCMRFYEYMQMPGIDQLTEHWHTYDTVKQLSSAARQFGRKWRLTETYGCTGWDFPLAGHKALGDWQTVLGTNLRCQHLSWYTMAGEAKRDYPAAISRQSPWYKYYAMVEDYFGRLNAVFSEGVEVRDILVVHPLESMWLILGLGRESAEVQAMDAVFMDVRNLLLENQLDFDYGDEDIMARHAAIETDAGEAILRIGQARYKAVVLPPMLTIRASTLKLLKDFKAAGGTLVAYDPERLPVLRDGVEDPAVAGEIADLLSADCLGTLDRRFRRVRVTDPAGAAPFPVLYQLRDNADGRSLMLCNTGFTESVGPVMLKIVMVKERTLAYDKLTVSVAGEGSGVWYELMPESGLIHPVDARRTAGGWEFDTSLAALETRMFIQAPEGAAAATPRRDFAATRREVLNPAFWEIRRDEPNVVVLDMARYRIGGGDWQPETFITAIDDLVRKHGGAEPRGHAMVQPWARVRRDDPAIPLELEFAFDCEVIPADGVLLAMEHPEEARVSINGVAIPPAPVGSWVDECLKTLAIPAGTLKPGRNIVRMELGYDLNSDGLESLFLLGEFGVRLAGDGCRGVITALPDRLAVGDYGRQGFASYSGNLSYVTEIDYAPEAGRVLFRAGEFGGAALRVRVGDAEPLGIAWPPYEAELTAFLKPGRNRLEIEVLGTRRNSHGPFFHGDPRQVWYGSDVMKAYNQTERLMVKAGLLTPPELIWER